MGIYYVDRSLLNSPIRSFTTDGCSGGMSWLWKIFIKPFTNTDIPWENCCVKHDREYWRGGSWSDRVKADLELYECVHQSYPVWAWLMYHGVRIGGSPFWPFGWRWGYGHRYPLWQRISKWK